MTIPYDYAERVYAGVLGKIIGVYLGRPFEGWPYQRIMAELGEIDQYVHERLGVPLIVPDDDISGTFTFLRALPDYGNSRDITAAQIGQTWLNYLIDQRTVLWWGGVGNSTEHTAYHRLRQGIAAPDSGSIAVNGRIVAEQIGAQIFIDGWAMVAPGDPELATSLARRAASVSHDGEAIYGAQVIAAMEAQAFVEPDRDKLLDVAMRFIPHDSTIYRVISDIRDWHAAEKDWHVTRQKIEDRYGYDQFGGNVHIVPNHALIILGWLYGDDDFQKSLMIVNTSGWDTDCNSGNLGCLLGIKNGLAGISAKWRDPVADRMYLPTADGGRAITDAITETYHVVNIGRALYEQAPVFPKNGARFHFSLPGARQGFVSKQPDLLHLENADGVHLAFCFEALTEGQAVRAGTPTFIPREQWRSRGYGLLAAPTLYSGQTVQAHLSAAQATMCRLFIAVYGAGDSFTYEYSPEVTLTDDRAIIWRIPDTHGEPIAEIGLELRGAANAGVVYLDSLTWQGAPDVTFRRTSSEYWAKTWVDGVDQYEQRFPESFRVMQNSGRGLLITGSADWSGYRLTVTASSFLAKAFGIAVCVRGMRRYLGLLLCADGKARLIRMLDTEHILVETDFVWQHGQSCTLALATDGSHLQAWIDDKLLFDVPDTGLVLTSGGIALVCEEGVMSTDQVSVQPLFK